jgi:hypothetical protein
MRLLTTGSGNLSICPVYGQILVDNMTNGFDLYTLTRTVPSKTFVVPTTKKFTKKAAFGENGHTVVTGSDHGQVYVFAINKTEPMQTLEHGGRSVMIQAVEVKFYIFLSKRVTQCRSTSLDNHCRQSPSNLQRIFRYLLQYLYLGEADNS